jgi:parvulin-like peptidyl-prolyl isomerase
MLEGLRRQGASIFVYLIFCLLIAIFIINFRPGQTRSDSNGCTGEANPILAVGDEKVSSGAWHIAYSGQNSFIESIIRMVASDDAVVAPGYWTKVLGIQVQPDGQIMYRPLSGKGKTHFALEALIRRELLAQEADSRGLQATTDLVEDQIKKGYFFLAGERANIPGIFQAGGKCAAEAECKGGKCVGGQCIYWNGDGFKTLLNELNVSKAAFEKEQQRSVLAWMMAQVLVDSVQVSRDEALQMFLYEGNTVMYDVVAFKPGNYAKALKVTDADLDKYIAAHEADVKAKYTAEAATYKGTSRQLRLREIYIAADKDKQDEAKKKLEDARAAIAGGKKKFADVAGELNTDEILKNANGLVGWKKAEAPSLGDKAVSDTIKDLKVGDMTPVIAGEKGVWLVTAEDERKGDLTFDQVKRDIAEQMAREAWGKEAARRAAIAAVEAAQHGIGANLDQLYEKEGPTNDLQKILNDPNIPDDMKQKLIQQMIMQQQGAGDKHGWIDVPGKDQLAGSETGSDGSAAGSAGSAGAAGAAGSGAATLPTPPAPPAPPVDLMKPSSEEIPKLGEVPKVKVTRYGPTPREKSMPGLGTSKDAISAVFEELAPTKIATKIYEADGNYIVLQLIARENPDVTAFDKDADERVAALRTKRGEAFLDTWLRERCEAMVQKGKIVPNPELLRETDEKGNVVQTNYRPCSSFH